MGFGGGVSLHRFHFQNLKYFYFLFVHLMAKMFFKLLLLLSVDLLTPLSSYEHGIHTQHFCALQQIENNAFPDYCNCNRKSYYIQTKSFWIISCSPTQPDKCVYMVYGRWSND